MGSMLAFYIYKKLRRKKLQKKEVAKKEVAEERSNNWHEYCSDIYSIPNIIS